MSEPVILKSEQYWELRTRLLEHQQMVRESQVRINVLLAQVGLDPKLDYQLKDADLSATVKE